MFPFSNNCLGCLLVMWALLIFRIAVLVYRMRILQSYQRTWCLQIYAGSKHILIYHKGVMVIMLKAPSRIPAFNKEAPSGFLPFCRAASWAAYCYQSLLPVYRVYALIAADTISSTGTQYLYFSEILFSVALSSFSKS